MIGYWDLTELYDTNDNFLNDLELCKKYLNNLENFRGKLNKSNSSNILDYFKLDEKFSILLEKLMVFAFCKQDDDGKNNENVKNYGLVSDFCAKAGEELAFAKTELSMLDEEFLNSLKNNKDFSDFDREIEHIIRLKKHTLSEKDEQNLAMVSSFCNTDDIFSVLSNIEMDHGSFENEKGEIIKLFPGNYNTHMNSPSQKIRSNVSKNYLAEYGRLNQTFANLFSSHVKYQNYLARTYGFASVLDRKTYLEEVSPEIMLVNIKNVKSHINLIQDYFDLKKKILGLKEFKTSDIGVSLFTEKFEKITYEQAVYDIKESFKVLGEDYVLKFNEAVSNGWIDAFPRETKKSGGYTISAYGVHPYILLNFDGTMDWASAIAHEFGHAMHSYYSAKSQPYAKADYTLFVAEVVSLTNELLYSQYLIDKATDKFTKMKLIADFLQLFELNVFDSSMLAEFELFVHDKLQDGETLTAEDYNNKFVLLSKEYFGDIVLNDNYQYNWCRKGHIYRDYYLYKYSLGMCCACVISRRLLTDTTGEYLKKYKQFLCLGGSKDPISSLLVADINVLSNEIYEEAFKLFNDKLNELKILAKEK